MVIVRRNATQQIMRKFLKKIMILISIMVISSGIIICCDFFIAGNQYQYNYQAAAIDKMNRLEITEGPRIILVGNSNLAFGINSEMIEEYFGMPVVNLGLHGALGNAFHENMIKGHISEGDIVIICHTDYSDDDALGDPGLAWITIEKNFQIWDLIRITDIPEMIRAYPRYALKCLGMWFKGNGNEEQDPPYSRGAFNEYGDIVYKPDYDTNSTLEEFSDGVFPPDINDTCINRINELNDYILNCGGTLLVAGYPIGQGQYTADPEEFQAFENELRDRLNCPVISTFTDYFIPYEYFYNSKMHLTDEGTVMRTDQLIEDLENWGLEEKTQ